jgi:hypothetical protein
LKLQIASLMLLAKPFPFCEDQRARTRCEFSWAVTGFATKFRGRSNVSERHLRAGIGRAAAHGGGKRMDMTGEERIAAGRDAVWRGLNDPEILKRCIPGCQSLEMTSPTELAAVVKIKIGPVSASFTGNVVLSNLNPPQSYTISGEGKGGIAGFAKGGADVALAEDGDETVLRYDVKAEIGGKLAQLGSRLIDSTAKKLAQQFFADFSAAVGGTAEAAS